MIGFAAERLMELDVGSLTSATYGEHSSDRGLKAAANRMLRATAQRCRVHFIRNALAHASKGHRRIVKIEVDLSLWSFAGFRSYAGIWVTA